MHLFVNMFSLYFIGNFLEMIIGKKRFFWLYLISGLFAGLFFAFFAFVFVVCEFFLMREEAERARERRERGRRKK